MPVADIQLAPTQSNRQLMRQHLFDPEFAGKPMPKLRRPVRLQPRKDPLVAARDHLLDKAEHLFVQGTKINKKYSGRANGKSYTGYGGHLFPKTKDNNTLDEIKDFGVLLILSAIGG